MPIAEEQASVSFCARHVGRIDQQTDESDHDSRTWFVMLAAIGLVALTLIMTVSVVTRSPADPIATPIWPISAFYSPDSVALSSQRVDHQCVRILGCAACIGAA